MAPLDHGHSRPADGPQKWASVLAALAAIGVAGMLTYESMDAKPAAAVLDAGAAPTSSAEPDAGTGPTIVTSTTELDAGLALALPLLGDGGLTLPVGAPRAVKMGVVLVTFAGAEGAPNNARPKAQAKELADGLLPMAQADFHGAVGKGDSGSADDIGRIPRGVLDPAVEAVVFSLAANGVSDVIETPKGYWIVKRLD
ncbi:MAG: peptidylprolyl isomerase [Labilithrix sp.]|nr:peptidylprolyl isomerase [Labilithrix sp.]MCW5816510.1 peptidylprolyl isomerase [Labilithrix sp.]